MMGSVLDYVVLHTIKDGHLKHSGEQTVTNYPIKLWVKYPYRPLRDQPQFKKILDVGSYNVNGSLKTYDFFGRDIKWRDIVGGEYIGLDLGPGPCVDVVANANAMPFESSIFDLVLCLDMLEHDPNPLATLAEIGRVLTPDGFAIITTVDEDSPAHGGGHSPTYNFFTEEVLLDYIDYVRLDLVDYIAPGMNENSPHHFLMKVKKRSYHLV